MNYHHKTSICASPDFVCFPYYFQFCNLTVDVNFIWKGSKCFLHRFLFCPAGCHDISWLVRGRFHALGPIAIDGHYGGGGVWTCLQMKGLHERWFGGCCSSFLLPGQMFWPFSLRRMVSSTRALCQPPSPLPSTSWQSHLTHDILIYSRKRGGFAWSSSSSSPVLLVFQPLSAANHCHCHYSPAEHTAVLVAEPDLIHTPGFFSPLARHSATGSAQWTTFTKLRCIKDLEMHSRSAHKISSSAVPEVHTSFL